MPFATLVSAQAKLCNPPEPTSPAHRKFYDDTVRRLRSMGHEVTVKAVQKHYETYRNKVNKGETTLWGFAFVQLLPEASRRWCDDQVIFLRFEKKLYPYTWGKFPPPKRWVGGARGFGRIA